MGNVPATNSIGSGRVTVTLNKTTGDVTVTGMFSGLSAPATEAHLHGPAAAGAIGPVLFPLTVTPDTSGAVTGNAPMNPAQMSEMLEPDDVRGHPLDVLPGRRDSRPGRPGPVDVPVAGSQKGPISNAML